MFRKKGNHTYSDEQIQKNAEMNTVRKIVAIIIVSLILILVVGGISGYIYVKSALKPVNPSSHKEISINVPMGSSTSEIASILEKKNIIKDARVFRFYIKFKNEGDFQAGEYTFNKSMSLDGIIKKLKHGKVEKKAVYSVTIPEGETIKQMATIYAKQLPITKDEFLKKVNDQKYIKTLIKKYPTLLTDDILNPDIRTPLEGYLFAATYSFYDKHPTVDTIVNKMLEKSVKVISPYLDDIKASNLSIHEAMTMASLIEKETGTVEQRKKIAGVFYNRLKIGMPLQTDPTVLYALGHHKKKVMLSDLKIESPYNTYYVHTLPVGPIGNFGKSSLLATIHPEKSDYLYFLHDDQGKIHYAATNQEHIRLKKKYIK